MNGKRGILKICLALISAVVLPIAIMAAATASPFTPFAQVPGKNDPVENRASSDVLSSDVIIMPVSTNTLNGSMGEGNSGTVFDDASRWIVMREGFKTEYVLDYDSRSNKTLHAIIAKGARDQLDDVVHTLARNSATVNATGILRNLVTNTTAELDGLEIIKDVVRSQIESALLVLSSDDNQSTMMLGMGNNIGSQLTLETETELTCVYKSRSYAECEIIVNIGQ